MTARSFLVRGLLAGLVAGIVAFIVGFTVGEPPIDTAIGLEEAASAEATPVETEDGHGHAAGAEAEEEGTEVSRDNQKTWGLATATIAVGVALGGIMSLLAASVAGRIGRLRLVGSTALVVALGFVAYALLPFLKYPAAPPAVGSGDTIGSRTSSFFGFVLISVLAMVLAVALARRFAPRLGGYVAVVAAGVGYVAVMAVTAALMPAVNEVGEFPADVLWEFRVSSLLTLVALWATLGVALTGLLRRLELSAREPGPRVPTPA